LLSDCLIILTIYPLKSEGAAATAFTKETFNIPDIPEESELSATPTAVAD